MFDPKPNAPQHSTPFISAWLSMLVRAGVRKCANPPFRGRPVTVPSSRARQRAEVREFRRACRADGIAVA